ncbi:MAG: serine/threonine protein kinase [bacterium]|nr:serine/threonine protein kinase [bacterium]
MIRRFFKKKSYKAELNLDVVLSGRIYCSGCRKILSIENYSPLTFSKCMNCSEYNFIPKTVKNYCLYLPLGGGGMGTVYKAINIESKELLSVKIILQDLYSESMSLDKIIKEYQIGKSLPSHPNITPTVELFSVKDNFYLVSEFIDGTRMDNAVDSKNLPPATFVIKWAKEIASALQHIYNAGYLYRDLKPQNIIIEKKANSIKIIDFGLAKALNEPVDGDHIVEGSPEYNITPERSSFQKEGVYSEIYSLGMVMYFCFTGKPFFYSESAHDLVNLHKHKLRVRNVSSKLINVNPDICKMIEKMIKKNPMERYVSYDDFITDLNKIELKS